MDMVRLQHILDSWKTVRQDTAAAVEEFPADQMDYRPTPDVATFGEIGRHILYAGEGLTGLLLAGEEVFGGPDFRDKLKPHYREMPANAGSAELADALRRAVERRTAQLADQVSGVLCANCFAFR